MREAAEKLSLTATAMHGTSQSINKRIKELSR
jgi:hypothetical protein